MVEKKNIGIVDVFLGTSVNGNLAEIVSIKDTPEGYLKVYLWHSIYRKYLLITNPKEIEGIKESWSNLHTKIYLDIKGITQEELHEDPPPELF